MWYRAFGSMVARPPSAARPCRRVGGFEEWAESCVVRALTSDDQPTERVDDGPNVGHPRPRGHVRQLVATARSDDTLHCTRMQPVSRIWHAGRTPPGGPTHEPGYDRLVRRIPEPVRQVVHFGRRLRGYVQLHGLDPSGHASSAVRTALQQAIRSRPSSEEREWITQIERLRALLRSSPQALDIVDYGAGPGHRYDTGQAEIDPVHIHTRTLGEVTRSSKPPRWAYLLLRLIREVRPESVLKMGSNVGISACYQAAALELNGAGRLLTLEGAPVLATRSARSIEELALSHRASVIEGRFKDTLDNALDELKPIDMAFLDGCHLEAPTLNYTERILAVAAEEAVLVFDDIRWSPGMAAAWSTIAADPRFALTLDLRSLGIAVVSQSARRRTSGVVSYG